MPDNLEIYLGTLPCLWSELFYLKPETMVLGLVVWVYCPTHVEHEIFSKYLVSFSINDTIIS